MKNKQKKKWIGWVALALAAAILAGLPMIASGRDVPSDVQRSIQSASAERRNVDTVLLGGGQLESSGVYNLKIPENVKIKNFLVGNGDLVQQGDAIAQVDSVSVMTAITEVQETLQTLSETIRDADSSSTSETVKAKPGGRVKCIYGKVGDSVEEVMLQYGALAVLSLDDTMVVELPTETSLTSGDKVSVSLTEKTVTGRVKSNVNGVLAVTLEDDHYPVGTQATIQTTEGEMLGTGTLEVYNGWNVTAYSGVISSVKVKEEQSVSANQTLFSIQESGKSAAYQRAIDKRQKYETLMQDLFTMYRSGVITAPSDGIVSGIDLSGAYMLSAYSETAAFRLVLLNDTESPLRIATTALPGAEVGQAYSAFLQAIQDEKNVTGIWAVSGLPAGLSCDESSGLLSGTPTVSGSFPLTISFTADGDSFCTAELTLTVSPKPEPEKPQYVGYLAQVLVAGGDVIQVRQSDVPYTISDLQHLPNVTVDEASLTTETVYAGGAIADGQFSQGDVLWIVLDENGDLILASKVSSGNQMPGGTPGGGSMPGGMPSGGMAAASGGGMSGGFGGAGAKEDDELYPLEKISIATVTSQEKMTLSIAIDELDITKVFVGQNATISMNAFSEKPVEAVVREIANSGENSGGNSKFTVKLELQKSSQMLPGMRATATLLLETEENALCIPASALYEQEDGLVVYTSFDEKNSLLSDPVSVTIGCSDADYVQILTGLQEGQRVYYEVYNTIAQPVFR